MVTTSTVLQSKFTNTTSNQPDNPSRVTNIPRVPSEVFWAEEHASGSVCRASPMHQEIFFSSSLPKRYQIVTPSSSSEKSPAPVIRNVSRKRRHFGGWRRTSQKKVPWRFRGWLGFGSKPDESGNLVPKVLGETGFGNWRPLSQMNCLRDGCSEITSCKMDRELMTVICYYMQWSMKFFASKTECNGKLIRFMLLFSLKCY